MNLEQFKAKHQVLPVEHYPHQTIDSPLVSVCVQTYQHAKYIRECLNGIVSQKTDFPFEILLGEDASDDGTRAICLEMANKHPTLIRLFLHKRENNIKYFGVATGKFNFAYNMLNAKGKYIAFCEGDDFWNDPHKLQKQVAVLEENPELAMCTHETHHRHYPLGSKRSLRKVLGIIYRDAQLYGLTRVFQLVWWRVFNREKFWFQERSHADNLRKKISTLEDFADGRWYMSFCSILMRRAIIDPLPECYSSTDGGHQLTLLLGASKGGILHLKEKMAVKRDQETSVSMNQARKKKIAVRDKIPEESNLVKRYECLKKYTSEKQKVILDKMINNYLEKRKS